LILNLGALFLGAGLAVYFDLSLIMVAMAIGAWLTNSHSQRNEKSFEAIKKFTPPIYTIFFILVGARLKVDLLPQMGIIGLLYLLGRTTGKWSGAYVGARLSGAPAAVRKYLGLALFSQAGVALGLALDIFQHFSQYGDAGREVGSIILNVIASTTFIVQIIGPYAVKIAIKRAGEIPDSVR
jgi:Kef-type K+ transport system membrane component KefB